MKFYVFSVIVLQTHQTSSTNELKLILYTYK